MNKLSTLFLLIGLSAYCMIVQADANFPLVRWMSSNQQDTITIENGNNMSIAVSITVDKSTSNSAGIIISNCGGTSSVSAGSTAVCYNNNGVTPITFSSESSNIATGSYQVSQR